MRIAGPVGYQVQRPTDSPKRGHGQADIARTVGVTDEVARYRYNSTGVGNQAVRR